MHESSDIRAGFAPRRLRTAVENLEKDERLDPIARQVDRASAPVSSGPAASLLRGDWLGHALHPLLTDLPLGCWISAGFLDLLGGRGGRRSAQRLVALGLLWVPPTVAAGLSEMSLLRDQRSRRVAAAHAAGNTAVALLYFSSWRARRRGHHLRGVTYGLAGAAGALVTGYLGGHLSFARHAGTGARGLGLSRDAAPPDDELIDLSDASRIIGVPVRQIEAMVEEGLLDPATTTPEMRFRPIDVETVRLLGA